MSEMDLSCKIHLYKYGIKLHKYKKMFILSCVEKKNNTRKFAFCILDVIFFLLIKNALATYMNCSRKLPACQQNAEIHVGPPYNKREFSTFKKMRNLSGGGGFDLKLVTYIIPNKYKKAKQVFFGVEWGGGARWRVGLQPNLWI